VRMLPVVQCHTSNCATLLHRGYLFNWHDWYPKSHMKLESTLVSAALRWCLLRCTRSYDTVHSLLLFDQAGLSAALFCGHVQLALCTGGLPSRALISLARISSWRVPRPIHLCTHGSQSARERPTQTVTWQG
jgi:hypothetical protein